MTKRVLFLLAAALFLAACPVTAEDGGTSVEDILDGMKAAEQDIRDARFSFSQEIELKVVAEKHFVEGELVYKQPRSIYHRQIKPVEQISVINEKELIIYNPATNQVYVDTWKNWPGITYFVPGIFNRKGSIKDLEKYFEFRLFADEEEFYILHVVPADKKKVKKYFKEQFDFYLWVDKKDMFPRRSKLISEDVVCVTDIKDWEVNTDPDDEIFEFEIPEGAEVIKLK